MLNEQEVFWAGEFGDNYVDRNSSDQLIASNIFLFSRLIKSTNGINNVIELGANIGMNLYAINNILPGASLTAVEINKSACEKLSTNLPNVNIYNESLLTFDVKSVYELVLLKGVLIHQDPSLLPEIYNRIYTLSSKYIFLAEYYSPDPVGINYRGHTNKLFKRDFAGEMLDLYPSLTLIDYGFSYHRDPNFPQDDINWFLLEKN